MSDAFLRALTRWAARHVGAGITITIPTGTVGADELTRVLRALGLLDGGTVVSASCSTRGAGHPALYELRVEPADLNSTEIREPHEMPAATAHDQSAAGKARP
jgi:hypothetical protein